VLLILISTNVPDYTMSLLLKRQNPHLNHTLRYSLFDTLRLLRLQLPVQGLSEWVFLVRTIPIGRFAAFCKQQRSHYYSLFPPVTSTSCSTSCSPVLMSQHFSNALKFTKTNTIPPPLFHFYYKIFLLFSPLSSYSSPYYQI